MRKKPPVILKEVREKQLPQIDYATQKSISYSQMSMFNECPKKWSLQYREGHKQFTSSIHTVFGTALHETLQHYLTVMYEQSGAAADRLNTSEMLEEKLREEYKAQYNRIRWWEQQSQSIEEKVDISNTNSKSWNGWLNREFRLQICGKKGKWGEKTIRGTDMQLIKNGHQCVDQTSKICLF